MYVHYYMISVILPITTMQSLRISYKILMHVHTFVGTLVTYIIIFFCTMYIYICSKQEGEQEGPKPMKYSTYI